MSFSLRKIALAALPAAALGFGTVASAQAAVQLGFILDRSGSIGSSNWTTIVNGLSTAVNTLIPLGSQYEVSVVTFATTATANISNFLVTDATSRALLASQIAALPYTGGSTDYAAAFTTFQTLIDNAASATYLNFATDGEPNSTTAAVTARNSLIAAGVDNLSIEGIGINASGAAFLQNSICYPGPCDATAPYNFPTQGFYIGVADAAGYAAAIGNKIQTIIQPPGPTPVPEPVSMALFGVGLAGIGLALRRKVA